MPKTTILCLCTALLLACGVGVLRADSGEASGETMFRTLRCTGCHKLEGKGVGLSLKQIAKGYSGQAGRLNSYLAGQAEAMLNPAKARVMARHIKKTKN